MRLPLNLPSHQSGEVDVKQRPVWERETDWQKYCLSQLYRKKEITAIFWKLALSCLKFRFLYMQCEEEEIMLTLWWQSFLRWFFWDFFLNLRLSFLNFSLHAMWRRGDYADTAMTVFPQMIFFRISSWFLGFLPEFVSMQLEEEEIVLWHLNDSLSSPMHCNGCQVQRNYPSNFVNMSHVLGWNVEIHLAAMASSVDHYKGLTLCYSLKKYKIYHII